MAEILSNGELRTALTDWTVQNVDHLDEDGAITVGCSELDSITGATYMYQTQTSPTISGVSEYVARLAFSFKKVGGEPGVDLRVRVLSGADEYYDFTIEHELYPYGEDEWHRIVVPFLFPITTSLTVRFDTGTDASANLWRLSDISVDEWADYPGEDADIGIDADDEETDLVWMIKELMRRRHDPGGLKHVKDRYARVIRNAGRSIPQGMWVTEIDTSLATVAEQREYDLSSITNLKGLNDYPKDWMVRQVFIEDFGEDSEAYFPVRRWHIEDDHGTLYLIFHADPIAGGREIKIEYLRKPTILSSAATDVDEEWLLAKAMTLLLVEADPERENPEYIAQQYAFWDAERQKREQDVSRQAPPFRFYVNGWREYIPDAFNDLPHSFYTRDVNSSSLETDEDTRVYSLATLTTILEPWQVRHVWIEDADEDSEGWIEIGRWHVEEDLGALSLILHEDPPDEERAIKIEYLRAPAMTDDEDDLGIDWTWLEAKCRVLQLLDMNPLADGVDANWITQQLTIWDAKRQARERIVGKRNRAKKYMTTPWRSHL